MILLAVNVRTDRFKVMLKFVRKVSLWVRRHQYIPIFVEQSEVPVAVISFTDDSTLNSGSLGNSVMKQKGRRAREKEAVNMALPLGAIQADDEPEEPF